MSRVLTAILAATIIAAPGAAALAQKAGGTLHVSHRDNPPSASIHEEATISTVMPFASIYNNLVVFDPKEKQDSADHIVPELATEWTWSNGGKDLTFKLRDDVKWHDGKPFTSADVKCTWDMLKGDSDAKVRRNPRKIWYFNLNEVTTNGPTEVTFHLGRPQPSLLTMLAGGHSPVYPCHVPVAQMRTKPIGTGPFKFDRFKQNESIRVVRNPDYWKKGKPYLDAIEFTIIPNRATSALAFTSGKEDMTFTAEVTAPLMKDIKSQAPKAICEMVPTFTFSNLLVNRDRPPFDNAQIRTAMSYAIDRSAFVQILSQGTSKVGGIMLPPPEGRWGLPKEILETIPGYGPDVEKNRAEGKKIMEGLGYTAEKPLKLKIITRNIPTYRDPTVILIDHLKKVNIDAELDALETAVWYNRLTKRDFSVALNVQGVGIDDPDVVFYETFAAKSDRNYTNYSNPEIENLFDEQSQMTDYEARRKLVWEIDKKLQIDGARPVIVHDWGGTCWQPYVKGVNLAVNSIYNHWRFEDVWLDK
jgi:peptide/nickel transport system substrate-binding protein